MAYTDELVIPHAARKDKRSFELLRVWIAEDDQHVSLRAGAWKDASSWGVVLADLAGHIANAMEQTEGADAAKTKSAIKGAFLAELAAPTGEPSGDIE